MKMKSYSLAIALLAISASVSAHSARGETPYFEGRTNSVRAEMASPEQLAELAADLARTAAQLAEVRKAQSQVPIKRSSRATFEAEAARRFRRPAEPKQTSNTVRWLGTQFEDATVYEPTADVSREFEMPAILSVQSESSPEENGFSMASDQSAQRLPRAQAYNSRSQIVRTQAYADPYQPVRQLQHAIPEPTDGSAPTVIAADDGGTSNAVWNGGSYGGDVCCDGCCDVGCDPCCGIARCPRRRTLVVSTEAIFLGAEINGARTSYFFEDYINQDTYGVGQAFGDAANDDFYIAPRISLGIQGECWGIMGRYFHLRAGENAHEQAIPAVRTDPNPPYAPNPNPLYDEGFSGDSLLEAYYTDLEVTRNFCLHGCKNQFSFGVRYAEIEHHESVYGVVEIPEGLLHGGARADRRSNGTGLTFGLNGRKPLFCNSCAHWFYNARSSILWGCTSNAAETWSESIVLDQSYDAIAGSRNGASVAVDDDLFIGEIQAGIEWDFALRCLPAKSFFRLAFEYQYWDAAQGHAGAGSYAGLELTDNSGTNTITDASTFADAPGLQVDLIGFHVGTGFTW